MQPIAFLNKKGVSLVEVMISLVVMLVVFLALMQTALLSINLNMTNTLRDEATKIAETEMNNARSLPFDDLTAGTSTSTVSRSLRNINNFQYSVSRVVTDIAADYMTFVTVKQVVVGVTWEWKDNTVANGNAFNHTITTIIKRS
jgi:prepilin-type N-terminal cleavage/methylation domain-containing protein